MFYTLDQGDHYVPIISPLEIIATDVDSAWVKISNAHFVEFSVLLGTITGDTLNITIECATEAASTSAITAECYYSFSSAVTNTNIYIFYQATCLERSSYSGEK